MALQETVPVNHLPENVSVCSLLELFKESIFQQLYSLLQMTILSVPIMMSLRWVHHTLMLKPFSCTNISSSVYHIRVLLKEEP